MYSLLRRTPHPVIVAIRDNRDSVRVLLYSYFSIPLLQGGGVLLTVCRHAPQKSEMLIADPF